CPSRPADGAMSSPAGNGTVRPASLSLRFSTNCRSPSCTADRNHPEKQNQEPRDQSGLLPVFLISTFFTGLDLKTEIATSRRGDRRSLRKTAAPRILRASAAPSASCHLQRGGHFPRLLFYRARS